LAALAGNAAARAEKYLALLTGFEQTGLLSNEWEPS
jgi:hypothetical protein